MARGRWVRPGRKGLGFEEFQDGQRFSHGLEGKLGVLNQ